MNHHYVIHVSLLEAVWSQPFIWEMSFLLARCPHCLLLEVNDNHNVLTPAGYFMPVIIKDTYCKSAVGGRGDRINRRLRSERTVSNKVSFASKWVIYHPRFSKSLELQVLYFVLCFQWLHGITHFRKHDVRQFFYRDKWQSRPAGVKLIAG